MSWTIAPIGRGSDLLYSQAGMPSLDLRFAESKTLVDYISNRNLITFFRASTGGTYVDSQGVIRNAVTNLLLRSEEFDDASWSAVNSTVDPNTAVAPNGILTADKQTHTGSGPRITRFSAATVAASSIFTFSFYAKAGTSSFAACSLYDGTTSGKRFWFDLSSGTPGSITNIGAGYPVATSQMQSAGNGWYRCIATITNGSNTTVNIDGICVCLNQNGVLTPSVSGLYGYIWGAQLEQSSTVGEYVPTTSSINSAPRFDHNPTTGESLGLLVEESRQNLVLNSATFQPTSGGSPASYTVDQVAPDGTTTGSRQTASNPRTLIDYTGIANATYTFSFYCRVTSGTAGFGIQLKNAATDTIVASTNSPVATTSWQRFSITGTTSGATAGARVELTGVVPGFVFWGAQLEAGAFPTSYIPTTASTVTRAADVASISGSNFSSWYRQDEGTVFADARVIATTPGTNRIVQLGDGTTANRQDLFFSGGTLTAYVAVSGAAQVNAVTSNAISANQSGRNGYAYKQNDFEWMLNAGPAATDTSGSLPVVDRLAIGTRFDAAGYLNGHLRRLTYWGQRLPNSALQAITQQ